MDIQRAYRFRFSPTAAQRRQLAVDFGCARWVWNHALARRTTAYRARKERLTGVDISREITQLKTTEVSWLKDANSTVLTQTLRNQEQAFANFFAKRARYPRFKRREHTQSARYQLDQRHVAGTFKAGEGLRLPKLGALKVRWSRIPAGVPKMVTVSKDACGRYFVAFGCLEALAPLPATGVALGIDLGVKDVFVGSDGFKSGNPKHLATKLRRLRRYQRAFNRTRPGSNRRQRARFKVARMHARVAQARRDWLHKQTTAIVRRADVIALEDLHVKGMVRNRRLARVLSDAGLGEVRRQITYKAAWHGRNVLIVGRFEPTSKTCSACGSIQREMPLAIRAWTCPECTVTHDRDTNAARNVLMFATGGRPEGYARRGRNPPSADHTGVVGMRASDEARICGLTR